MLHSYANNIQWCAFPWHLRKATILNLIEITIVVLLPWAATQNWMAKPFR